LSTHFVNNDRDYAGASDTPAGSKIDKSSIALRHCLDCSWRSRGVVGQGRRETATPFFSRKGIHCWCSISFGRAGFTPSRAPVQKNMWGPLLYEYSPQLPSPDTHTVVIIDILSRTRAAHYYCSSSCL